LFEEEPVITEEGLKMAANPHLHLVAPTTVKQTVAPDMDRRRPNRATATQP
jgi:hypothetical protein